MKKHFNLDNKNEAKYTLFFSKHKKVVKWVAIVGILVMIYIFYLFFKYNLFNRPEVFEKFIRKHGIAAPLVYFCLTFVNAIYPIIPGGMGNVVGYSIFGSLWGFLIAFIANILGSLVLFSLARIFGKPILYAFFDEKIINKYIGYLDKKNYFAFILAIVFIVPGLPDDVFTMVAGLSSLSVERFMLLQLTCKPITTFVYMSGINRLLSFISNFFK